MQPVGSAGAENLRARRRRWAPHRGAAALCAAGRGSGGARTDLGAPAGRVHVRDEAPERGRREGEGNVPVTRSACPISTG